MGSGGSMRVPAASPGGPGNTGPAELKDSLLVLPGERLPLLHRGALALVFALLALLAAREVASPDVGFHLKAGEYILAGHGWPRADSFTYTIKGHPYLDTSWGYQVLLALLQRAFDAPGLVLFHDLLVVAMFFTLYRTARLVPVDPASLVLFFLAGGLASEMRFEVRPELVSYLFLALAFHILHRHAEGLRSPLWLLPAIHLAWVNTHSLFVLGWGAEGCFLAGLWFRDQRSDRKLLTATLGSVAVTLINPYGWRGALFPFSLATRLEHGNLFRQSIGEFVSPFLLKLSEQFPFYPHLPIYAFRALAVLSLLVLPALWRRKRFCCLLISLAFLPLAVLMIRNMPLLVVGCLPGVIWGLPLGTILQKLGLDGTTRRLLLHGGLASLMIGTLLLSLCVVHDGYYIASRRPGRFGLGWSRLTLPTDAVRYADRVGLTGPVLNHLNFGGFLMWSRPEPVFIDGRLEVLGEDSYSYYLRVLSSEEEREACVARYGIRWMIFPYVTNPVLLQQVGRDPRWRLAHVDSLAVVFVRNGPGAENLIDPSLDVRPTSPETDAEIRSLPGFGRIPRTGGFGRWLSCLIQKQEFPAEDLNRGMFHYFRGELNRAEKRFAAAIRASRGAYYELYSNLGAVLYAKGRFGVARECYLIVLGSDPENRIARERLAEIGTLAPPR